MLRIKLVALPIVMLAQGLGAQSPRIRDSAGVQIVENPSVKSAPIAFRLGDQPKLDLGAADPAHPEATFDPGDGYLAAVRLSNGQVVVSDNSRTDGALLKYFDAKGKYLRSDARDGRSPAYFGYITTLCRTRGDTVIANDARNFGFAVFDEMGVFVRFVQVAGPARGNIAPQACLDDGSVIVGFEENPAPDDFHPMARYSAWRTNGTVLHEFGTLPGTKYGAVSREVHVTAVRDTVFVADGLSSEVRVYTAAGKLVRIIRSADPVAKVTPEDIAKKVGFNTMGPTGEPAGPIPPEWPAYAHVMQDPLGRVWMEDPVRVQPRGWTVFDATGKLLGRLALPVRPAGEHWSVVSFGADEVEIRSNTMGGPAHLLFYPLVPAKVSVP